MFFAHGSSHSCGVLVLVRDSLESEMKSIITDDNGRYILLSAKVQGSDYILGNIYAPNKIKEQCIFFVELQQKLNDFITIQDQRIIIGRDFNLIMDQNLDCAGSSPKEKESVKFLNDICFNYDLIDIWRIRNPDSTLYTHIYTQIYIYTHIWPISIQLRSPRKIKEQIWLSFWLHC